MRTTLRVARETDTEFLLRILGDGQPHTLNDILRRSFLDRGCGLTVHSRAADARAHGHNIVNWKDGSRGDGSWYQLLSPLKAPTVASDEAAGALSGGTTLPTPSPVSGDTAAAAQLTLEVAA